MHPTKHKAANMTTQTAGTLLQPDVDIQASIGEGSDKGKLACIHESTFKSVFSNLHSSFRVTTVIIYVAAAAFR